MPELDAAVTEAIASGKDQFIRLKWDKKNKKLDIERIKYVKIWK